MGFDLGALLAGLGGGATSLAESLDAKERERIRKAEADRAFERLLGKDKLEAEDRALMLADRKDAREEAQRDRATTQREQAMRTLAETYGKAGVTLLDPQAMQLMTSARMTPTIPTGAGLGADAVASISNAAADTGSAMGAKLPDAALQALTQSGQNKGAITPLTLNGRTLGTARNADAARMAEIEAKANEPMTAYQREYLALQRAKTGKAATTRPPTDAQRRNASLLMMAEQANNNIRSMGSKFAPSLTEKVKSRVGMDVGNVMNGEEFQKFNQAALQLSDAWLRYTSGAAVPETEVMRFAAAFTPRPGDTAGTLAQKAKAREMIIRAMREGSGAAISSTQDSIDRTLDDIMGEP